MASARRVGKAVRIELWVGGEDPAYEDMTPAEARAWIEEINTVIGEVEKEESIEAEAEAAAKAAREAVYRKYGRNLTP